MVIRAMDNKELSEIVVFDCKSGKTRARMLIGGKRATITINGLTNGFDSINCYDKKGNAACIYDISHK